MTAWCRQDAGLIRITVQASPNAKRTEVADASGEALKIRLHAPPVDGKANLELLRFVAERLGLPKRAVRLARGQTGRRKVVEVEAPTLAPARAVELLTAEFKPLLADS